MIIIIIIINVTYINYKLKIFIKKKIVINK